MTRLACGISIIVCRIAPETPYVYLLKMIRGMTYFMINNALIIDWTNISFKLITLVFSAFLEVEIRAVTEFDL